MRYRLLCVGRRARDPLIDAADAYAARLSHYAKVDLVRLREAGLKAERDAILSRLDGREHLAILDECGQQATTEQLTKMISGWQTAGTTQVAFVVGGADGLHEEIKQMARTQLALSRLTLPHRLAQVVLLEQLYRAHTILRGEPYHRG